MKKGDRIMWLIILAAVMAAVAAGVFYMLVCVGRFGGIRAIAGERKWLRYLISFGAMAAVFAAVAFALSVTNAVIVFLHEVLFFLLFGGIMRIVTRVSGKEFAVNWQGWLAIGVSVVYLLIAYYLLDHVWQKNYTLTTEKDTPPLRIAMFADSHLGTTFGGDGLAEHLKDIEAQHPDILLIPGDFVDDSSERAELEKACEALGKMDLKYGVWFSYGNHDMGYYNSRDFSAADLEEIMRKNGIHVLKDEYEQPDDSFYVVGRLDSGMERMEMNELLSGIDESKYIIVLDHEPNDYDNEAASAADLVVSGHTHGGQLFPITYVGVWFGINDRTYGYERRNATDFIVTSGISDWEILFKTGTKSEYVIIDVNA